MISNIKLTNFRSYKSASFDFSEKTNIILGKNGAGKTNILEAILFLASGKSYRASDRDLIKYSENTASLIGKFDERERNVKFNIDKEKNYVINNSKYKRMQFTHTIPVVLFEPEFMQIIARGPDTRRDYFDSLLSRINPTFQTNLNKYKRSLAQRNNLLKSRNFSSEEMFVWNIKLSELGGIIVSNRLELIEKINQTISDMYSELASKKHQIKVEYISKINAQNYTNNLLKGLEKNLQLDKETGFTSLGPHRDDFEFVISGKSANISASRGENRTLLLAMKIIETKLIKHARDIAPILLLDDVFSELDEERQGKLIEFLYDNQVIITTTTITPLMKGVSGKIIEI
ncbi:MAG: DNA replication and repair protein RecF [Candidatus Saccharibacteria bacterium]|nr:DNA replication and repair protein RecF [Candidatus Saccharibacteria bacterium]